jgi:hypothetical protein
MAAAAVTQPLRLLLLLAFLACLVCVLGCLGRLQALCRCCFNGCALGDIFADNQVVICP